MSAGNYSVSISYSLPWKAKDKPKPIATTEAKKRKKTLKPILYPIFEKCSKLTEDKFWQSIFMECAIGHFPRGFSFKNNLITHRKGNKLTRLELTNSPTEVFLSTMEFFSTCAGIMSATDRKKMQKIEEDKLIEKLENSNKKDMTWKDIKTEKIKEILICEFISDICENLNFDEEDRKELTTTIKKGFLLKYFNSTNIYMEDGKISEIDGLIYDEKEKNYIISPEYTSKKTNRKYYGLGIEKMDKKVDIDFMLLWHKYLETLEAKNSKKISSYSSSYSIQNDESEEDSKTYEYTT